MSEYIVGAQGPCTDCDHKPDCPAYAALAESLFQGRAYITPNIPDEVDIALDSLADKFISMMKLEETASRLATSDRGLHLSAFFDLAVSGIYTNNLLRSTTEFSQEALLYGPRTAFFPYTWMNPGAVSEGLPLSDCYLPGSRREKNRDYPITKLLAKPGGRYIGDVGIKVLKAVFRAILKSSKPYARMRDGGGERGEFDLTITDKDHLIFLEVKAKPLVCYPLKLQLVSVRQQEEPAWASVPLDQVESLSLFLAASEAEIPLGKPSVESFKTWPLKDIKASIGNREIFSTVVSNWVTHLNGYRQWDGESRNTRWHRFGCGNFSAIEDNARIEKRVANTKELPGLDRTDDIKKGAAQLLKFSRFKFDCKKHAIRCVLAGNTYAETHYEHYIEPLVNLKIKKADDVLDREEWIFDALVGLTKNILNSLDMEDFFSPEKL